MRNIILFVAVILITFQCPGADVRLCMPPIERIDVVDFEQKGSYFGWTDDHGRVFHGFAACANAGSDSIILQESALSVPGRNCLCRLVSPVRSKWVYVNTFSAITDCFVGCSEVCARYPTTHGVQLFNAAISAFYN